MISVKESRGVGFKLMVSEDTADIVDVILDQNPDADAVLEPGGYYELDGTGEIVVDLDAISEVLDRLTTVEDFLVHMASYYGRISVEGRKIRLSSEMLGISDYEALAGSR